MPVDPSNNEDEYFLREEMRRLKQQREQAADQTVAQEKEKLKRLHWMRCPKCGMELAEIDFRGVKVDACFACKGMFFDEGEVDRLSGSDSGGGVLGRISKGLFG